MGRKAGRIAKIQGTPVPLNGRVSRKYVQDGQQGDVSSTWEVLGR